MKTLDIMRKLSYDEQALLQGGGAGRTCMIMGGIAFFAALGQQWGAAIGTTVAATVYGCFE
jgi:hypothetical protein